MNHSEQINELAAALCAAQAEFSAVPKTADNPFFKSKFADLPTVVASAAPILTKHGLAVSQFLGIDGTDDTLTTWLLHKSGQFIAQSMRLHLTKQDAQGQGSATTYARRYSYMSVLGLVAEADDDGNAAARPAASSAPQHDDRIASEKQRNLVFVKARNAGVAPGVLANMIKIAAGDEPALFETDDAAKDWLDRALPKLPARLVNPVLESIANEMVPA